MTTVPQLAQTLQTVFTTTADGAARATGAAFLLRVRIAPAAARISRSPDLAIQRSPAAAPSSPSKETPTARLPGTAPRSRRRAPAKSFHSVQQART